MAEVAATPSWHRPLSGLSSALLSVWMGGPHDPWHNDVWMVGADKADGTGPIVIHGTTTYRRVDLRPVDPEGGHLWWVFGPDADSVWMVGERGRAFRYDRKSGTASRVETGTDATLYGIWGADGNELWAVGGYVFPRVGPPTLLRLGPGGGAVVAELPAGVIAQGTFFKVWGTARDDVWVVGELGMVLRYDGSVWSRVELPSTPRLVTIHGRSKDDLVVVGGVSQALILEGGAAGFVDRSPGPYAILSGVFVGPDGESWAAGMLGQVMRRSGPGAGWAAVSGVPVMKDWHAVWRDHRGDWWFVGGNLLSAARFDDGTVLRFGPPRTDGPSGPLIGLEPDPADDGPMPEAVEGAEAVEVVEVVEEWSDVVEPPEMVDTVDGLADGAEVAEDAILADLPSEVDGVVEPEPFEVGEMDPQTGEFVPFANGHELPLIHGPQGGFHVEAVFRFEYDSAADPLESEIVLAVLIDRQITARFHSLGYPVPRVGDGLYRTYTMFAMFCADPPPGDCFIPLWDSALYDGKSAVLEAVLSPPGVSWRRTLSVVLRDTQ
jgi:hypothetical protein